MRHRIRPGPLVQRRTVRLSRKRLKRVYKLSLIYLRSFAAVMLVFSG